MAQTLLRCMIRRKKVSRLRQNGGSLEIYYNTLQGLWREVDFRRPNPCEEDILVYKFAVQEDRVYMFLDRLDDRLDNIRADTLRMQPFPTVEQAYAHMFGGRITDRRLC